MNKIESKKKKRIRNIAIIFFMIIVILTFFSNTIMNASLLEITAQYVTAGTITEKISGSGTVTASTVISVSSAVAGTISSVSIENGDEVKEGDLLCTIMPESTANASSETDSSYDDAFYTAV